MVDAGDEAEAEPRDRPFFPYRCAKSDNVRAIIQDVLTQVQNFELHDKLRKRRRREADQVSFEATISAIICDLIHLHLTHPDRLLAITRSNQILGSKGRYRPAAYGKALPVILDRLASPEMNFIKMSVGNQNPFGPARQTAINASKRLTSRITQHEVTLDDLGALDGDEIIILKRAKEDRWDEAEKIEYEDTPQTHRYRKTLRTINQWLDTADISFDEAVREDRLVDVHDRRLRRYFTNGSFESGGRLFGGFWQQLKKRERLMGLRIDGDEVVSLDYSQMAPRILYGMAGKQPPARDAYDLDTEKMPRQGVKKIFGSLLFTNKPLARMPKGTRELFDISVGVRDVVERIEAHHPDIRHLFGVGIGHRQQLIESEILIDVLMALKDRNIVALPIHDAVVIAGSRAPDTRRVMEEVFQSHTGIGGLVARETAD